MPWLLGWDGVSADPEVRKAFEVALHAGTAAALVVMLRDEVIEAAREVSVDSAAVVALSLLPPVIVGFALQRPIERYLGKPGTIAVGGLIAGGVALGFGPTARPAAARSSTMPRRSTVSGSVSPRRVHCSRASRATAQR